MAGLHVVLGAGQVGSLVAERLAARGLNVRLVRRTAVAEARSSGGVEMVSADLADAAAAARAMEGASVAYHCATPPYHTWHERLMPLTLGILEGAARASARLVVLDNLYMYGDATRMDEDTPVAPRSQKGLLRAKMAEALLGADARGDVRVAIGRASDWFGPGATGTAQFGDRFYRRLLAGKPVPCLGDPDEPHAYAYTPDVAAGLVSLGEREDAFGKVWMLPVQPAEPTRAVIGRFERALGRDVAITRVRPWMLRALGVFVPDAKEVVEMLYQWRQPFTVDDRRFRAAFGFGPTAWDEAISTTIAWARPHYAAAPPRRAHARRPAESVRSASR
jgi:nucleoside-diphosphate-sugar epimerase